MRNLLNIEKSGFHRGQYVGYAGGRVFRITRGHSSLGKWRAFNAGRAPAGENLNFYADTLEQLSAKLATLPALHTVAAA